jgi:hypothetical protein
MMGMKAVEPQLYVSFSLDDAVPRNHLVRGLSAAVDFSFVHGLVGRSTATRGSRRWIRRSLQGLGARLPLQHQQRAPNL